MEKYDVQILHWLGGTNGVIECAAMNYETGTYKGFVVTKSLQCSVFGLFRVCAGKLGAGRGDEACRRNERHQGWRFEGLFARAVQGVEERAYKACTLWQVCSRRQDTAERVRDS